MTSADPAGAGPAADGAVATTTARGRRRREDLLDAAEQLFLEQGFHGTSVDDLGAAAGISGPGLYRHFASKDAVLMAVLDRIWGQLRPAIDAAADQDPDAALATLLDAQLGLAMGQPSALVLLVRELRHLDLDYRRLAARNHRRYVDAWVDALRRRAPHLGDEAARSTVLAVHGLIDSAAINPEARRVAQRHDWLRDLAIAVLDRATRSRLIRPASPGLPAERPAAARGYGAKRQPSGRPDHGAHPDQRRGSSPRSRASTTGATCWARSPPTSGPAGSPRPPRSRPRSPRSPTRPTTIPISTCATPTACVSRSRPTRRAG